MRGGSNLPLLILDRDSTSDGAAGSSGAASSALEAVTSLNLAYSGAMSKTPTASSPPYVVEDPEGLQPTIVNGTPPAGITTASRFATTPLVDGSGNPLFSAIIVASDNNCGGCDLNNELDGTHVDSDAINARTSDITTFFNAGGGLLYLAGATDAFTADGVTAKDVYYASVPVPVGGAPTSAPYTVTPGGMTLGITSAEVNCCATHNSFVLPGPGSVLKVAETDSSGLAESLFATGATIGGGGFTMGLTTSKAADSSTVAPGGQDGYTITIANPNSSAASLTDVTDTLATGFGYVAGSATGVTTADPSQSGQALTFAGPFSVPANGSVTLHFKVTAPSTSGGPFYDVAGGDAGGGATVSSTGPTAPVTVTGGGGGGGGGFVPTSTTTTLASSANPSVTGQRVTYTATVRPKPDGGSVRFLAGGRTIRGCAAVAVNASTGKARCRAVYGRPGSRGVQAVYAGDSRFTGSQSAALLERVRSSVTLRGFRSGRSGMVKVRLSCAPRSGGCHVADTLITFETIRGRKLVAVSATAGRHRRAVLAGRKTVTIAAGKTITITIKLDRAGRKLLSRFKRLPVRLAITLTVNGQRSIVATRKLTLKSPRERARRRPRETEHDLGPGDLRAQLGGLR